MASTRTKAVCRSSLRVGVRHPKSNGPSGSFPADRFRKHGNWHHDRRSQGVHQAVDNEHEGAITTRYRTIGNDLRKFEGHRTYGRKITSRVFDLRAMALRCARAENNRKENRA